MNALQNSRVQSALLLGGLLVALFSAGAPHAAAAAICPHSRCGGLTMSPASQTAYVQPGQTYEYTYSLTNDAPYATAVQLRADSAHQWPTSLQLSSVYLKAYSSADIRLKVAVPPNSQTCICFMHDQIAIRTGSLASQPLAMLYLTNKVPIPALR